MRTFDEGGGERADSGSLKRDFKTLRRILLMILGYWTHGRRVREAYRKHEAAGTTYWVDER